MTTPRTLNRRGPRTCRGLAAVEAALVLPVLLLLMVGVAELGRALYQYVTLTAATRDAARYLAGHALVAGVVQIDGALTSGTRNVAVFGNAAGAGAAALPGFAPGNVTVTNLGGGDVAVSTTYTYQPIVGAQLPTFGIGTPVSLAFTLTAQVSMRAL